MKKEHEIYEEFFNIASCLFTEGVEFMDVTGIYYELKTANIIANKKLNELREAQNEQND